jgi:hypothetical protein
MSGTAPELRAVVRDHERTLGRLATELEGALAEDIPRLGRTRRSALIVAGLLERYYTNLETVFLRISQMFENNLTPDVWHRDLLLKMTIRIEGVREPAVSLENHGALAELMKFRHFARYYYEIDFDWRKLDYLVQILCEAHPRVVRDLEFFADFLQGLDESAGSAG